MSPRLFSLAALAAATLAAAPATAQVTIVTPPDANGGYAGPFASAASGGTARFAQTFGRAAAGFDVLRTFTFSLGDFNPDGSGAGLQFRASVFAVDGTQLGARLYQSDVRTGSGNYVAFDPYLFAPGVTLTPGVTTFALVLEAVGGTAGASDVIATSGADYAGGQLFAVDASGNLVEPTGADAFFSAAFGPAAPASAVPEPTTVLLLAGGLAGVGVLARRRGTS